VTSRDSKKEVFDEVILGDNALVEWVLYGHISCHYPNLPKSFDLNDKLKPWTRSIRNCFVNSGDTVLDSSHWPTVKIKYGVSRILHGD